MSNVKSVFADYVRVYQTLRGDNALKKRLGKKTLAVCRPNQTFRFFPAEIGLVVDVVSQQGWNAASLPKNDIIKIAHRLLVTPSEASQDNKVVLEDSVANEDSKKSKEGESDKSAEKAFDIKEVRPGIPYIVGVAILSNLHAACQLLQPQLADAEVKIAFDEINHLIDSIHRRVTVLDDKKESNKEDKG